MGNKELANNPYEQFNNLLNEKGEINLELSLFKHGF